MNYLKDQFSWSLGARQDLICAKHEHRLSKSDVAIQPIRYGNVQGVDGLGYEYRVLA